MRLATALTTAVALLLAAPTASTAQILPQQSLSFGPANAGDAVTYRFAMKLDREPAAPAPQTITFFVVDAGHVRLANAGGGPNDETLLAERSNDGRLHAKLKRGSPWYVPIQLYNRLASTTAVAAGMPPGTSKSGGIPLFSTDDSIPGTLSVGRDPAEISVSIDARGPVDAPRELIPANGRGAPPAGDQGGGPTLGGGQGGPPGGGGHGGGGPGETPQANATLHMVAHYPSGIFSKAESAESMTLDGPQTASIGRSWTVERV
jgi:hypothetical protein